MFDLQPLRGVELDAKLFPVMRKVERVTDARADNADAEQESPVECLRVLHYRPFRRQIK